MIGYTLQISRGGPQPATTGALRRLWRHWRPARSSDARLFCCPLELSLANTQHHTPQRLPAGRMRRPTTRHIEPQRAQTLGTQVCILQAARHQLGTTCCSMHGDNLLPLQPLLLLHRADRISQPSPRRPPAEQRGKEAGKTTESYIKLRQQRSLPQALKPSRPARLMPELSRQRNKQSRHGFHP